LSSTDRIVALGKKYDNPQHQAQRKMRMKQLQSMVEVEAVEEDNEIVLKYVILSLFHGCDDGGL
jgi:hypothetical protein